MGSDRRKFYPKQVQATWGGREEVDTVTLTPLHGRYCNLNGYVERSSPIHSSFPTRSDMRRPRLRSKAIPTPETSRIESTKFQAYTILDEPDVVADRFSAKKALIGRNTLEILIFRLLGAKLPRFSPDIVSPPSSLGLNYGLVDKTNSRVTCLGESPLDKMKPSESNLYFSSEEDWRAWGNSVSRPLQEVYTDGSFQYDLRLCGYSVWWGEAHINNAYGPLPINVPLCSSRAEEYAVFLALFQIKAEVAAHGVENAKYSILTDSQCVIKNIKKWVRLWSRTNVLLNWREPAPQSMRCIEIIRAAAGLMWDLRLRGAVVEISHVKAHVGTLGNEIADIMAKIGSSFGGFSGPRPAIL